MVIKLYISGISGNKEVKKKQQRVQMILDSKQISYEAIDITEPGKEKDKEFMQQNGKVRESLGKYPLPPQIFNDDDFCGDYEDFDMANEVDELEKFLHIETNSKDLENGSKQNAESASLSKESLASKKSSKSSYDLYNYHTFTIKFNGVNGLQEEIISTNNPSGENEQFEEVTKNEVNGESEAVPSEISSADNKPEFSAEEVPSSTTEVREEEKEGEETKTNENTEERKEESEAEKQENENKEEEEETKGEEEENLKEGSDVENPNEEESPHSEKEEEEEENEEEKVDNEGKENESEEEKEDSDSPQSEKSQED